MVRRRVGSQHLGGAGLEVGDHRVHRHARAGDQDAGLAGGAKVDRDAALCEGAGERERGVLLAERAVGADGEQALAGALAPGRDRDARGWRPDVDEAATGARGRGFQSRYVGELACMPLTMSRPASSASTSSGTQLSAITPPVLATPITRPRAPWA